MTPYKKIPYTILNKIIRPYAEGKSKDDISYLMGMSENNVTEIIKNLDSPEYSNLLACHVVLKLRKDGRDAKDLVELIQLTSSLTQQGVEQKDAVELATNIAVFCHKTALSPDTLVTNFKRYHKIAPNNVKTFADLQAKLAKGIEGQKYLKQDLIELLIKHK